MQYWKYKLICIGCLFSISCAQIDIQSQNHSRAQVQSDTYCTPENGYQDGYEGIKSIQFCDQSKFPDYSEQFKIGHRVRSLEIEKNEIKDRIKLEKADRSTLGIVKKSIAILTGESETKDLEKREQELNDKIRAIDNNAPGGPQVRNEPPLDAQAKIFGNLMSLNLHEIKNYFAAAVGTVVGFGVGHAIQDRYSTDGWKWTASDFVTITAVIRTSNQTCRDVGYDPITQNRITQCHNNGKDPATANMAGLLFFGMRIWQAYDLWTYHDSNVSSQLTFSPSGLVYYSSF